MTVWHPGLPVGVVPSHVNDANKIALWYDYRLAEISTLLTHTIFLLAKFQFATWRYSEALPDRN